MRLTQFEVVRPAEPTAVGDIKVEVDVAGLELLDGVGNAVLLGSPCVAAEAAGASDHVAHGVGLENDSKLEIRRCLELLRERQDVLVAVPVETILAQAQLTRRMTGTAVTVRDIVENEADDGSLAAGLGGTSVADGIVDIAEQGNIRDPDKAADVILHVLHLGGIDRVSTGQKRLASLLERLGVLGVDEQGAAREGVTRLALLKLGKGRGSACGE